MPIDIFTASYQKTVRGDAYIISEKTTVGSSGTFNIMLENPSNSEKTLVVSDISISGAGPYEADIYDGFSSGPTGGTDIDTENLLLDANNNVDEGIATTKKDVTFTADSSHAVGVAGSSGVNASAVFGGEKHHPMMVMQPSRTAVVELTNTDGGDAKYSITITYFETSFDP